MALNEWMSRFAMDCRWSFGISWWLYSLKCQTPKSISPYIHLDLEMCKNEVLWIGSGQRLRRRSYGDYAWTWLLFFRGGGGGRGHPLCPHPKFCPDSWCIIIIFSQGRIQEFQIEGAQKIIVHAAHIKSLMPWSHLCVKPPRMSNVRQII